MIQSITSLERSYVMQQDSMNEEWRN